MTSVLTGSAPSTTQVHSRATAFSTPRADPRRIATSGLPRASSTIAVAGAILASLAPSLLPRTAPTQAVFSGTIAAVVLGIVILARRLGRHVPRWRDRRAPRESMRFLALTGSMVAVSWAMILADHWQDSLRTAMGMPTVGPGHWIRTIVFATATFLILVGVGIIIAAVVRRLGWIGSVAGAIALATGLQLVAAPTLWAMTSGSYSDADTLVDVSVQRPMSGELSGSSDSAITWESLGRQGRRFVAAGEQSPSIRTYVGVNSAPDVESRASLAVSELERAGGFARSAIVVAVPTGSGWIDENAVDGFEERFDGDVAIVGMQYSYLPSWMAFMFNRSAANESAAALFDAIADRIENLPADGFRPMLYVYGQSLGSVGGSAIFASSGQRERQVCAALWAGPPARSVEAGGATVIANTSDPVVWWSPGLVLRRPDLAFTHRDAPVPQWIPGITFLQTSVDLISALNVPVGHGHRYGTEQGTALPDCAQPGSRSF
ncbi:hypothetical protein BFN03_05295 [Rhodococcus sp. WMMA185]|uniref:alpha/beta-hydrolase family protein n=1 Tax=Rhodococcus sp. WMMA185 TaxID=679318 RepID=UPI000878270A|nr:alpha/beta-hydrolase family protein [Rhodococcus sp. WMMA185]AOW92323.1 hypothetical protein BFN03_05295 [Rhodococcus sp. WMMA185]